MQNARSARRTRIFVGLLVIAAVVLAVAAPRISASDYGGNEGGYQFACGTSGTTIIAAQLEYESPVCNAKIVRFYAYRYDPNGCAGVYDAWVAWITLPSTVDWRWHQQFCIDGLYHWSVQMPLHLTYAKEIIDGPAGTNWQINLYR
jgi:hypothetical protein